MIAKQPTLEADYLPARMLNEFTYCPRLHSRGPIEAMRPTFRISDRRPFRG